MASRKQRPAPARSAGHTIVSFEEGTKPPKKPGTHKMRIGKASLDGQGRLKIEVAKVKNTPAYREVKRILSKAKADTKAKRRLLSPMATIVVPAGSAVRVRFASPVRSTTAQASQFPNEFTSSIDDGEFEIHYDSPEHPGCLIIKETAGLPGNQLGKANSILYSEFFGKTR